MIEQWGIDKLNPIKGEKPDMVKTQQVQDWWRSGHEHEPGAVSAIRYMPPSRRLILRATLAVPWEYG